MKRILYTSKLNIKKKKKPKVKSKKIITPRSKKYIPKYNYQDARWVDIRLEVLMRDKECLNCGSVNNLQCRHTYYINERKPWEYPLESFQTLCVACHKELHLKTKGSQLVIRSNKNIQIKLDYEKSIGFDLKKKPEIKEVIEENNKFTEIRKKAFASLKK